MLPSLLATVFMQLSSALKHSPPNDLVVSDAFTLLIIFPKSVLEIKANYLLSFYRFTFAAGIGKAHSEGIKVIVGIINKKETVLKYAKKGVDGISSDKPDILGS